MKYFGSTCNHKLSYFGDTNWNYYHETMHGSKFVYVYLLLLLPMDVHILDETVVPSLPAGGY